MNDSTKLATSVATHQLAENQGGCKFSYENGEFYVQAGADTASKKKLGSGTLSIEKIGVLGNGQTLNCTHIDNYESLRNYNFLLTVNTVTFVPKNAYGEGSFDIGAHNYDSVAGTLTAPTLNFEREGNWINFLMNVYLIRVVE